MHAATCDGSTPPITITRSKVVQQDQGRRLDVKQQRLTPTNGVNDDSNDNDSEELDVFDVVRLEQMRKPNTTSGPSRQTVSR